MNKNVLKFIFVYLIFYGLVLLLSVLFDTGPKSNLLNLKINEKTSLLLYKNIIN